MHLRFVQINSTISIVLTLGFSVIADDKSPKYWASPPPLTAQELSDMKAGRVTEIRDSQGNIKVIKAGLFTPRPEYPQYARSRGWEGAGMYVMNINKKTGLVSSVDVIKSTGHRILDDAVVAALRRWKFKPGLTSRVRTPVTFNAGAGVAAKQ
jgi:TonB family protein